MYIVDIFKTTLGRYFHMATIQEDYKRPLSEIYKQLPDHTREWIDDCESKVHKYFFLWFFFLLITSVSFFLFEYYFLGEPIGISIQRFTTIFPYSTLLAETFFVIKMNDITSVKHYQKLTAEIYLNRKCGIFVKISIVITFILVGITYGLSAYADLLLA